MKGKSIVHLKFCFLCIIGFLFIFQFESFAQKPVKKKIVKPVSHAKKPLPKRKAHLRYKKLPKHKTVVVKLPPKAVVVKHAGQNYFYNKGVYYAKRNNGFIVVKPRRGIRIKTLPVGHRRIIIRKKPYYYYYGEFYTKLDNNIYEVVDPPEGAIVDALPDGYEAEVIDGTTYYVLDGVYYKEVETDEIEGGVGYQVVSIKN